MDPQDYEALLRVAIALERIATALEDEIGDISTALYRISDALDDWQGIKRT